MRKKIRYGKRLPEKIKLNKREGRIHFQLSQYVIDKVRQIADDNDINISELVDGVLKEFIKQQ